MGPRHARRAEEYCNLIRRRVASLGVDTGQEEHVPSENALLEKRRRPFPKDKEERGTPCPASGLGNALSSPGMRKARRRRQGTLIERIRPASGRTDPQVSSSESAVTHFRLRSAGLRRDRAIVRFRNARAKRAGHPSREKVGPLLFSRCCDVGESELWQAPGRSLA